MSLHLEGITSATTFCNSARMQAEHIFSSVLSSRYQPVDPQTLKQHNCILEHSCHSVKGISQPGNLFDWDHVLTDVELTAVIPLNARRYVRLKA